jgi:pyruvate,water dikinase
LAIYALKDGGTKQQEIHPDQQKTQTLTESQILQLAHTGKQIEQHFGRPQDIEWCLADDTFYIVQSRPITTLYPIPETTDQDNHVYISVGHQQMMTDAMKPLGLSFFLITTRALMRTAGGRLFVDVTPMLASPAGKETLINVLGKSDPIIRDALTTILERKDFIKPLPDDKKESVPGKSDKAVSPPDYQALNDYDPTIVDDLIKANQTAIESLKQNIQTKSG